MSEAVLSLGWPLGEPAWLDFDGGQGVIAAPPFLKTWHGVADNDYLALMEKADAGWWGEIVLGTQKAWLIGDVPGLLAPSVGRWADASGGAAVLGIWKWLAAPLRFQMPVELQLTADQMGRLEWSQRLPTTGSDMKLFCSGDEGNEVLQRDDLPAFRFEEGTSNVQVRTITLSAPDGAARFQLYLIWGTFLGCRWLPRC